jgi:hypothetical protein
VKEARYEVPLIYNCLGKDRYRLGVPLRRVRGLRIETLSRVDHRDLSDAASIESRHSFPRTPTAMLSAHGSRSKPPKLPCLSALEMLSFS